MAVVTPQQYRDRTGDTTHYWTEIEQWLADAQEIVEEALGRQLDLAERTETLPVARVSSTCGRAWPAAMPITAVSVGTITDEGEAVLVDLADIDRPGWTVALTYTAGWTSETVPAAIGRMIIDVAAGRSADVAVPARGHVGASR